jgi:hypothetical protein
LDEAIRLSTGFSPSKKSNFCLNCRGFFLIILDIVEFILYKYS